MRCTALVRGFVVVALWYRLGCSHRRAAGHLKPLELEAAAKAAALVQGCALEQRTAAMISANAALGNMMPALFRVVAGVVSRVQSSGRMRLGGATVAETLLGSDVLQAVCGALANLAHYPAVRMGDVCCHQGTGPRAGCCNSIARVNAFVTAFMCGRAAAFHVCGGHALRPHRGRRHGASTGVVG